MWFYCNFMLNVRLLPQAGEFIAFKEYIYKMGTKGYYKACSCWWNKFHLLNIFSNDKIQVAALLLEYFNIY